MKRKAILVGNTGGLNGVQLDIQKAQDFLCSPIGGAWFKSEIEIFENPEKSFLLNRIEIARRQGFDYAFVMFSGHGGYARKTVLEINGNGELISESDLQNIAPRQLTIFDCCRVLVLQESVTKSLTVDLLSASFGESLVRERYEKKIMQAIPQQARLYSCSIGEVSYDTANGAAYFGNFLAAARSLDYGSEFKTVESAHAEARLLTINAQSGREKQTPEAVLPKCLTSQQLIISMRS